MGGCGYGLFFEQIALGRGGGNRARWFGPDIEFRVLLCSELIRSSVHANDHEGVSECRCVDEGSGWRWLNGNPRIFFFRVLRSREVQRDDSLLTSNQGSSLL